jgi:hypothetical protein
VRATADKIYARLEKVGTKLDDEIGSAKAPHRTPP